MKILIATPIYLPEIGGPATYTKELINRLKDKHELIVVAYTVKGANDHGVKLHVVDKQRSLFKRLLSFFLTVWREAKTVDCIYVQNAMAAGLPTVLAAWLRKKPVILKFVGDEAWERATQHKKTNKFLEDFLKSPEGGLKIFLMRHIQGWVLRRCEIVTTPSIYLGAAIQRAYHLKPERILTNYNATEDEPEAPFVQEKKVHQLVATARLVAWKGIDGIIEALAILKENFSDITLIIHGDGPCRPELERLAKALGVEDRVTFTGNVSRSETWHTRKISGIYILNSTYEGLPHTALTSFAAGIPIIATNIAGTNEAVYHEESGLLIPTNDPVALSEAIKRLLTDQELRQRLVAGGHRLLQEKFSWAAHLTTLEKFLEAATAKPRD